MDPILFALTLIVGMVVGAIIVLSSLMYPLIREEEYQRQLRMMPPPMPYPPAGMDDLEYTINKHTNY